MIRWPGWFELNAYCPNCALKTIRLLMSQGYDVTVLEIPNIPVEVNKLKVGI